MLVALNQPTWGYLHHGNGIQTNYNQSLFSFPSFLSWELVGQYITVNSFCMLGYHSSNLLLCNKTTLKFSNLIQELWFIISQQLPFIIFRAVTSLSWVVLLLWCGVGYGHSHPEAWLIRNVQNSLFSELAVGTDYWLGAPLRLSVGAPRISSTCSLVRLGLLTVLRLDFQVKHSKCEGGSYRSFTAQSWKSYSITSITF